MDAKSSKRGQIFSNKTWLFVKLFLALDFSLFPWNGIEKHVKCFSGVCAQGHQYTLVFTILFHARQNREESNNFVVQIT